MFAISDGQQVLGSDSNIHAKHPPGTHEVRWILDSDPDTCGFQGARPCQNPAMQFHLTSFRTASIACAIALLANVHVCAAADDCQLKLDQASQSELGLTVDKFDQGQEGGWRGLAKAGCNAEAATLIERYLVGYESNLRTLKWHQAQLLAVTNQYGSAIRAAEQSINPEQETQHPKFQWNAYVKATVAFLQRDRQKFDMQLLVLKDAVQAEPHNKVNFDIVEGLGSCFDKPYKEAYSCRKN
jgi:hypothetical protein